ncbi:MAG: glycosyltransferase [Candidatus Dactylopiibacterium carminicum]|uniref:Glycosyltransferase n=1 Tax=Candidatus Dactylopiibacterium carminicum TaxID=857335 RepID=A0A272EUP5_9RHOO|nr:glycosyltransferase family 2 protein [Candidatus Dactylopiibacterium carminicum]KAF7600341.1 glycosyltransferase [Candidatus Dactylopiibacterium carminicum]PAS93831.1 MAG: glycosyltransferase [Candidatus Dactylopiibacterium carminicum]PAS95625.1 MAG: glycosyltransferase [Candidatus Dactylopiibacterium carminicum]PAT00343.1 MAG: glycosyltransferase [Candidatus Dactylopiibacterium carminicum]
MSENISIPAHSLSIVIPMYNEAENVEPMITRVHEGLAAYPHPWELILVDDGSADATPAELRRVGAKFGAHVRVVELARNFRQTAAMQAGIDAARGDVIVTLDGDLQNDPKDIPRMVARLLNEDLDMVAGWRKNRQDGLFLRKIPSRIANRLIARITGVKLNDYGCSLKAFRASVLKNVRLYGEMHRFIPAWLATVTTPRRIAEEVVTHHARQFGESKYGISRTFRVILDLISVYFFMRFRARPGHFFGGAGLILGAIGSAILAYMGFLKLVLGQSIGTRPLLLVGFFCIVMAVQFILSGVLGETLARIYFESGAGRLYTVRNPDQPGPDEAWHQV